jgi:alpha-galactosidase
MRTYNLTAKLIGLVLCIASANAFTLSGAETKPLKVFILAGQSNMQGHANISTFDYIGKDPLTAPILAAMRDAQDKPRVC